MYKLQLSDSCKGKRSVQAKCFITYSCNSVNSVQTFFKRWSTTRHIAAPALLRLHEVAQAVALYHNTSPSAKTSPPRIKPFVSISCGRCPPDEAENLATEIRQF